MASTTKIHFLLYTFLTSNMYICLQPVTLSTYLLGLNCSVTVIMPKRFWIFVVNSMLLRYRNILWKCVVLTDCFTQKDFIIALIALLFATKPTGVTKHNISCIEHLHFPQYVISDSWCHSEICADYILPVLRRVIYDITLPGKSPCPPLEIINNVSDVRIRSSYTGLYQDNLCAWDFNYRRIN